LAGFTGDAHDYEDIRSSLLHDVLPRRAGLPILLSVVWLEVARRSGVRADGIGLPGHFIARIDDDYVDPFSGGADVDVTGVPQELLRPWHANEILLRILTNIRVWARRAPDRASLRLWAVELSLLLPHHPAELRRERGMLLMSAGQFVGAARDLETYADSVAAADPAAAAQAAGEARAARARLN
jgi:regulator of sirC expression with transglutaminase-like and TPR domain